MESFNLMNVAYNTCGDLGSWYMFEVVYMHVCILYIAQLCSVGYS